MSIKSDIKLTSVKIVKDIYKEFKHVSFDENLNLQKLVNRSILLYINDEEFRGKINKFIDLKESGSSF
jgi:hypothetical protein